MASSSKAENTIVGVMRILCDIKSSISMRECASSAQKITSRLGCFLSAPSEEYLCSHNLREHNLSERMTNAKWLNFLWKEVHSLSSHFSRISLVVSSNVLVGFGIMFNVNYCKRSICIRLFILSVFLQCAEYSRGGKKWQWQGHSWRDESKLLYVLFTEFCFASKLWLFHTVLTEVLVSGWSIANVYRNFWFFST